MTDSQKDTTLCIAPSNDMHCWRLFTKLQQCVFQILSDKDSTTWVHTKFLILSSAVTTDQCPWVPTRKFPASWWTFSSRFAASSLAQTALKPPHSGGADGFALEASQNHEIWLPFAGDELLLLPCAWASLQCQKHPFFFVRRAPQLLHFRNRYFPTALRRLSSAPQGCRVSTEADFVSSGDKNRAWKRKQKD